MEEYIFKEENFIIVGSLFEVHKNLGKGFSEIVYKDAIEYELQQLNIPYQREKEFSVNYKETTLKHKFYNIQESLLNYRQHDANISKSKIENVNRSIQKVKTNQMSAFGIEPNDSIIDSYINAVSVKKGLNPEEIIEVIESSKFLLSQNKKLGNYSHKLLEKHISKTLIRTIRNAKTNNLSFYRYLKINEKELFEKISILDKTILFLKSFIR